MTSARRFDLLGAVFGTLATAALLWVQGCASSTTTATDESDSGSDAPADGSADGNADGNVDDTGAETSDVGSIDVASDVADATNDTAIEPDGAGGDTSSGDTTFVDTGVPADLGVDAGAEPALVTKPFTLSAETFLNPERGWMQGDGFALSPTEDLTGIRKTGYSVIYGEIRLDAYRTIKTIPAKFLTDLNAGFGKARAGKLKVVLRFTYNDPNDGSTQDAAIDVVLEHIRQLTDVIKANADVITVWQAGFIGHWGEWHSSTSGLDTTANRNKIINAIAAALPPGVSMQLRTPMFKAALFPTALTDAQAFDGSVQARIGHHNDCFLADNSDMGTYDTPVETWKKYVEADTRFTPMGGETCAVFPARTDCAPAKAETKRLHWSFMNDHWSDKVVANWKTQGCYDEIGKFLGYRLGLTEVKYSSAVRPGGILAVRLTVKNEGYAAPYNARPVFLTLDDGVTLQKAQLTGVDPRRFASDTNTVIDVRLRIPAATKPGKYKLALWMPDAAVGLQPIAEYAIRLANTGVWDATKGNNTIVDSLSVDAAAPGTVDPTATTFAQIK